MTYINTIMKSRKNIISGKSLATFLLLTVFSLFSVLSFGQSASLTGPSSYNDCETQTITITITNNGLDPATGISVDYGYRVGFLYEIGTTTITYSGGAVYNTDPADSGTDLTWNLPDDLPAGENIVITFDLTTGCVAISGSHTVDVSYSVLGVPQTSDDSLFITVNHGAVVVTKTPTVNPAPVFYGDAVSWTLTVENSGYGDVTDIVVTDTLGTGFLPDGVSTYNRALLAPGDTWNIPLAATVDGCEDLENLMSVSWGCGAGCQTDIESNAAIDLTVKEPRLSIDNVPPIVFDFCQAEQVDVIVRNLDPSGDTGTAMNPELVPTIPAGFQIQDLSGYWDGSQWNLPDIAPGGSVTVSFNLTTNDYCTISSGDILLDANSENVCGDIFLAPSVEISAANTTANFPSVSISKTAPVEIQVGETINYSITVGYDGDPSVSGDLTVVDNIPSPLVPENYGTATWDGAARTLTWTIPQASLFDGFTQVLTYDTPTDDSAAGMCDYCFTTFTNDVSVSTNLTCALSPGGAGCSISASASASTRINCEEDLGGSSVTGDRTVVSNTVEDCTNISYINTFDFGATLPDVWADIGFEDITGTQTPVGNIEFWVDGTLYDTRPIGTANFPSLSFLDTAGAPGPAGTTLEIRYNLYQNDTGSNYRDAILSIASWGAGLCGTGGQINVTEYVTVDASSGSISISANPSAIIAHCEEVEITLTISKGTYPLYNPVVVFNSTDFEYIAGTSVWNGDGVNFPIGAIEPDTSVANELSWNNSDWSLGYTDPPPDRYYAFRDGGTVTFRVRKSSTCLDVPDAGAELLFDDNCERLGRDAAPSVNSKSIDSYTPRTTTHGELILRLFPEKVTSEDDIAQWTITVVNKGDGPTYNTTFVATLGPDLIYDPVHTGPGSRLPDSVDATNRILTYNLGDIDPNDKEVFTLPARIIGCDEAELTIDGEGTWGCQLGVPTDCPGIPVNKSASVRLSQSDMIIRGSGSMYLCEQSQLTLEILNSGATVIYDGEAVYTLDTGMTYVAGSTIINGVPYPATDPAQAGSDLTWNLNTYLAGLGDMAKGETITLEFLVDPDCTLPDPVEFDAYASYISPCNRWAGIRNNTIVYELDIDDYRANLTISKTPATQTAELGDNVTWTVTIENTGAATAYEGEFYDVLPAIVDATGLGITNTQLDGGAAAIFDDGLAADNLGTAGTPRTLIDIPVGSNVSFDIVVAVVGCDAASAQNDAYVRWGCAIPAPVGCRFPYVSASAVLVTSPVLTVPVVNINSLSICGAEISFEVHNSGSRAYQIDIVDTIPADFEFIVGTAVISSDVARADLVAAPTVGGGGTTVTWDNTNIPFMYPDETITITFQVQNDQSPPPPNRACDAPINDTNDIVVNYENSCGDAFGPVNSNENVAADVPDIAIDIVPDTQIVPPGTVVCWDINIANNAPGGDVVDSVTVEFTFGSDYIAPFTLGNGSDGTVPTQAGNVITYSQISIGEGNTWTANVCADTNDPSAISNLNVIGEAEGRCTATSNCFYASVSDESNAAHGDMAKIVDKANATIGEEVTYTITIDYSHHNTRYDNFEVVDTLPANLTFISQTYTGPGPGSPTFTQAGQTLTWSQNFFRTPPGSTGQSVITIVARVDNVAANQDGVTLTNSVNAQYDVGSFHYDATRTVDFSIVEPDLTIAKTVARTNPVPPPTDEGDAGDTFQYSITVDHSGSSTNDAYTLIVQDTLPAEVVYDVGTQSSVPAADSFSVVGNVLQWTYSTLLTTDSIAITYDVTVQDTIEPVQTITNAAQVTWTSLSPADTWDGTANERDGSGGVNDYITPDTASFTTSIPSISKILDTAVTDYTIGSSIPYEITVTPIEGTEDYLRIVELLPDFLIMDEASIVITAPGGWTYTQTSSGPNDGTATTRYRWTFDPFTNSPPGQDIVVNFNAIVADVAANDDGESFTNRGRVRYERHDGTRTNITNSSVPITIHVPALVTNKTVSSPHGTSVEPGDTLTYTYTIQNVGTGTAYNVDIADVLPGSNPPWDYVEGSTLVNAAAGADPSGAEPNLTWDLDATIAGGATLTLEFDVDVGSGITGGTVYTNTASAVNGEDAEGNPIPTDNTDHVAGDTDPDDQDTAVITGAIPELDISKTVVTPAGGIVEPGDTITYEVVVSNVGTGTAYNVDIEDILPAGIALFTYVNGTSTLGGVGIADPAGAPGQTLTWDLNSTINGGSSITLRFQVDVTSSIAEGTVYTNTAWFRNAEDGAGTGLPDESDTADLTGAVPNLGIVKTVVDVNGDTTATTIEPGDVITYRVVISNSGTGTAYLVDIEDVLPDGITAFTYVNGTSTLGGVGIADPTGTPGQTLTWDLDNTINGGASITLEFDVNVLSGITDTTVYTNTGWHRNAEDGAGTSIPDQSDTVDLTGETPNLGIVKTVVDVNGDTTATTIEPGDVITYRIVVSNTGTGTAYLVDIEDVLPDGITAFTYVNGTSTLGGVGIADPAGTPGQTLTWGLNNTINGSSSITLEFDVNVLSGITDTTVYTNTGWHRNAEDGAGTSIPDQSDTVDLTGQTPDLGIVKTVVDVNGDTTATTIEPGDVITYRIVVSNTGTGTAYLVDIEDVLPDGVSAFTYVNGTSTLGGVGIADPTGTPGQTLTWDLDNTINGGTSITLEFDVNVLSGIVDATVYTNTGWHRNAEDGAGTSIPDQSDTADLTGQAPTLGIVKTVVDVNGDTTATTIEPGDVITYRVVVSNTGTGTAYLVDIEDVLPDGVSAFTYANGTSTLGGVGIADPTGTPGQTLTWDLDNTLNGGASITLEFDVNVLSGITDTTVYTNTGWHRNAEDGAGTSIPDQSDTADLTGETPILGIVKTVVDVNGDTTATTIEPGDVITYRIVVSNTGTGTAYLVDIEDVLPDGITAFTYVNGTSTLGGVGIADPTGTPGQTLTWDLDRTINGSSSITLEFDVNVLSGITDTTVYTNTGWHRNAEDGAGTAIPDQSDTADLTGAEPSLTIDKTVSSPHGTFVEAGDTVTYTVTVDNTGTGTAYGIDIVDTLPSPGFTYVANSTTLSINGAAAVAIADPTGLPGLTLTWDLTQTLDGGGSLVLTFDVDVDSDIEHGTIYTNSVITDNGADGAGTDIDVGPATVDLTAREPALVTDKTVDQINGAAPVGSPPEVSVGDVVTYQYTITNVGGGTAYTVNFTDTMPSDFTYENGSTNITWNGTSPGSSTANPAIAGDVLTFTTNATLSPGAVLTATFDVLVTNDAFIPLPAVFTNTATATGEDGAGTAIPVDMLSLIPADTDDDDTDTADLDPDEPALVVDKTVVSVNGDAARTFVEPGDTVLYRITVTNVGGAPALNIDLSDTIDSVGYYVNNSTDASWNGAFFGSHTTNPTSIVGSLLTWDSSVIVGGNGIVLSPSAVLTHEFEFFVESPVVQGGTVVNEVTAIGTDGGGTAIPADNSLDVAADTDPDDTDSVSLPSYMPGLVVTKTVALVNGAASTGFIEPGDVVTYQVTVQNISHAIAYLVDISDTLPSTAFTYVNGTSTLDGVGIADPSSAGTTLTWDLNATINGGDPTGDTIILRFNVDVSSDIDEGVVYTNTSSAINGEDGDGGAIATASGDPDDSDADDTDTADLTAREPALVTEKTITLVNGAAPATTPPIVAPTDVLTYQYVVTNVGQGSAYNVDLSDVIPDGFTYQAGSTSITWPSGASAADPVIVGTTLTWDSSATLAGTEALTLTFRVVITNDAYRPLPAGNWINTATATGDDGNGTAIPADNSTDVPADSDPDDTDTAEAEPAQSALVLTKEVVSVNGVLGATTVQPGDEILYRVTVTNVGRGLAFNIDLEDTLDIGLAYDSVLYGNTTSTSWTGDYAGTHTGDPSIVGTPPTGEALTWDSSVILGTADGIMLTESAVVTHDYTIYVTTDIVQGTPVNNLVQADAIDGRGAAVPYDNSSNVAADSDLDDQEGTFLTTLEPALVVDKTTNTTTVMPGQIVTFTVTVDNVGSGDAHELILTDTLPECFSYVPGTASAVWPSDLADPVASPWRSNPSISGNRLTFNINAVLNGADPLGESLVLTFQTLVGSGCDTQVINHVKADAVDGSGSPVILGGVDPDDNDSDDADDQPLTVLTPKLRIVKSVASVNGLESKGLIMPGDIIEYEIKVSNDGLAPLVAFILTDKFPEIGFDYQPGSATYNGQAIPDPQIIANEMVFSVDKILDIGREAVIRFAFKINDKVVSGTRYDNCADAVGFDGARGEIYTEESCAGILAFVPAPDTMNCIITSEGMGNQLCRGDIAVYCLNIENNDSLPYTSFKAEAILPVGLSYIEGTTVIDGQVVSEELVGTNHIIWILPTIPSNGKITVCFQLSATANAALGRQNIEIFISDIQNNIVNCEVSNTLTVDDCKDAECGFIEKLNYPIHKCDKLVKIIEPHFNTASAMYAAAKFYNFAGAARLQPVGGEVNILPDYDRIWKFFLLDIAEKNAWQIFNTPGLRVNIGTPSGNYMLERADATPYYTLGDDGVASYWSDEVSDKINLASIGMVLLAQSERALSFRGSSELLLRSQLSNEAIEELVFDLRGKVKLLGEWSEGKGFSGETNGNYLPKTLKLIEQGELFILESDESDIDLETYASLLLGLSKYLELERNLGVLAANVATDESTPLIARSEADKIAEKVLESLKIYLEGENVEYRLLALAVESLNTYSKGPSELAEEINETIRKVASRVTDDMDSNGKLAGMANFRDQINSALIMLRSAEALDQTELRVISIKLFRYIGTALYDDELGIYRSNTRDGKYEYTAEDIANYVSVYKNLAYEIAPDSERFRSQFNTFLERTLILGGMQLDDTWRRNQELAVSSVGMDIGRKTLYSVPVDKQLMSVMNNKMFIIDPKLVSVPEALKEMDGTKRIEIETLSCETALAGPSQKLFVTDIGSFTLAEFFRASTRLTESTSPAYLGKLGINSAWMLGQKIGEYALYNAFTIDYASKSGVDLRFGGLSTDGKVLTDEYLKSLLKKPEEKGFGLEVPKFYRPLFVKFGTSLPGADENIIRQNLKNPFILGYKEDKNIYLSSVGISLTRLAAEYRFIKGREYETENYILATLNLQSAALVKFAKERILIDSDTELPFAIVPVINSSGEPVAYETSARKADLFSYLLLIQGLLDYSSLTSGQAKDETISLAMGLDSKAVSLFYDEKMNRLKNSVSDSDLSVVNIYLFERILDGFKTAGIKVPEKLYQVSQINREAIRTLVKSAGKKIPVSLEGKPAGVSSVVDINTDLSAGFAALRTLLLDHDSQDNVETDRMIKALWKTITSSYTENRFRVFSGEHVSDKVNQSLKRFTFNSFDVGMVVGGLLDLMPVLGESEKLEAVELLATFLRKVVEIPQMQYLGRGSMKNPELAKRYLPGLRTEITLSFDEDVEKIRGAYPGDTVKYKLKIQNLCRTNISDDLTPSGELNFIEVLDLLPPYFKYVKGSTYVNGDKGPEPEGTSELRWIIKSGGEGIIYLTFLAEVDRETIPGEYINYARWQFIGSEYGTGFTSPTGFVESPIDILKPGKLTIAFFVDSNSNGAKDENEKDILMPYYRVTLDKFRPLVAGADGNFEKYSIRPGLHTLSLESMNPRDNWWISSGDEIAFYSAIEKRTELNIPLVYKEVVSGHVYRDLNGDGKYSGDVEGVKNVILTTSSDRMILSGKGGYFYYFANSDDDTIKVSPDQKYIDSNGSNLQLEMDTK